MRYILTFLLIISFVGNADALNNKGYSKVYKKWTRQEIKYSKQDFGPSILWEATLLSDDMIRNQAAYLASIYSLDDDEEKAKYEELKTQLKNHLAFFINFYTDQKKYADISNERHGWQLLLHRNGQKIEPLSIDKFKKPTPEQLAFYPNRIQWQTGYLVVFPVDSGIDEGIQLSLHHISGESTLSW